MTSHTRPHIPTAQGSPRSGKTQYSVIAAFDENTPAQHALEALGRAGLEGARTEIQQGSDEPETQADNASADTRVMKHWFGNVIAFAAMGGAIGFLAGIPLGIFVVDTYLPQEVTFINVLVAALLTGLGLSTVFGLVAVVWGVSAGEAWEQSFHEENGSQTIIRVHLDDREAAEQALAILSDAGPIHADLRSSR